MSLVLEILSDAESVAQRAATIIAAEARAAVEARGRFSVALSGGRTPWVMLRALSTLDVPWPETDVLQVDERIAPAGDGDRNLTQLYANLAPAQSGAVRVHPMPVEDPDPGAAAASYTETLAAIAGAPPVIDLVHLGMGPDGHTASLVPGDPVLDIMNADVAVTGLYQGRRRMTLTYPILNRARLVLWIVTGEDKAAMLPRLRRADPAIPAGRIRQDHAIVLADRAAAREE